MSIAPDSGAEPEFLDDLLASGLLIETGVDGVYGQSARFEAVRGALEAIVAREAAAEGAESLRFSPLLPRRQLERSEYLSSFPHLLGTVFAFEGDEAAAEEQNRRAAAHEPWEEHQRMTDVVLTPAACYPVYPAVAARGALPADGLLVETGGAWVFRHEPSRDPARRRSFRMQELVRIGAPHEVSEWHAKWAARAVELLRGLGLDPELSEANDPFFGRRGRLLAAHQREQSLKLELVAPVGGRPTAIASANLHRDHLCATFGVELAGGAAHSACMAFGHERVVLALLHQHGLDPTRWPVAVKEALR